MGAKLYLRLDGIHGDSADPAHRGWIEVLNYQWREPLSGTVSEAEFLSTTGKHSGSVLHAVTSGRRLASAEFKWYSTVNGKRVQVAHVTFTDVQLRDFRPLTSHDPSQFMESFTIAFRTIRFHYGSFVQLQHAPPHTAATAARKK